MEEASCPTTSSEVRSFLGLAGFSSRLIPDFVTIAGLLRALTRNGAKFEWKEAQEKAFNQLKEESTRASMLVYFDKTVHMRVMVDASPVGLGAVPMQEIRPHSRALLSYSCRKLDKRQEI